MNKGNFRFWVLAALVGMYSTIGFAVDEEKLYIEGLIERNITPGQEEMIQYNLLYPLTSLPLQIGLHPKITLNLERLQEKAGKALAAAKEASPDLKFSQSGIITVKTFTRQIKTGEQKFWIFTISYQKWKEKEFPGERVDVAHFIAGAYIMHEGKRSIEITNKPTENLNFLATFAIKDGPFTPKGEQTPDEPSEN